MSNLTQNTTNLQNILSTINDLPEANGGVSADMCSFTFSGNKSNYYPQYISYTTLDDNGNITTIEQDCGTSTSSVTVNCLCNSIVVVKAVSIFNLSAPNNASLLYILSPLSVFKIEAEAGGTASFNNSDFSSGGGVD